MPIFTIKPLLLSPLIIMLLALTCGEIRADQDLTGEPDITLSNIAGLIDEGERSIEKSEFENALQFLNKVLDIEPAHAEAMFLIGEIFSRLNLPEAAIEYIKTAVYLSPDNAKYHERLATLYESGGAYAQAAGEYELIIGIVDPGSPAAKQAQKQFKFATAGKHARRGELQTAIALYRELLIEYPDDIEVNYSLGVAYLLSNQHAAAEIHFRKVLEANPEHIQAYYSLASLYEKQGNLEQALTMLQKIITLVPESRSAARAEGLVKIIKGRMLARGGNLQEALKLLQEALLGDPDNLRILFPIAGIYRQQNKVHEEAEALERVLDITPGNLALHKRLGAHYLEYSQFGLARPHFENIVQAEPDNRLARMSLALCYDNLGMLDKAIEEYATVISLESSDEILTTLIASLQLSTAKKLFIDGEYSRAKTALMDILENTPSNATAHLYLGLVYSEDEDYLHAAEEYQAVLALTPSHLGARAQLALSYESLNREYDAIAEYRRILQEQPNDKLKELAKDRITDIQKRINGITTAVSYSLNYDDNTNLSDTNPIEDYHFDATFNLAYQYKSKKRFKLLLGTTPEYQTYQNGNFDFLNVNTTVSLGFEPGNYALNTGYTHRIYRGLVNSKRFSRADNLFFEGRTRKRTRSLTHPFSGKGRMSDFSLLLSYIDFDSDTSSFFSARTYAANIEMNQRIKGGGRINIGYGYVKNDNKESLGRDYAFQSHGITIGLEKDLLRKLPVSLNYRYTRLKYSHPDTFAGSGEHRDNRRHMISLDASYFLLRNMKIDAGISWTRNDSNLPVGFVLNPQDIIEGQQSSSLGDYERMAVSLGMELVF